MNVNISNTQVEIPPFPTTTTHAIRLCLFQPTRRPIREKGVKIATPWGTIKRWGKLGQQHADVLESICFTREGRADLEDGRIKLLVDPAKVRKLSNQASGTTFNEVLKELEQAVIEIIEPCKFACSGHLIDHITYAQHDDGAYLIKDNPFGGERKLWRVELGKALCTLVAGDIWVGYNPSKIAKLDHGITQAIARHVLSHKNAPTGGWRIDTLIRAVAGDNISDANLWNRRRELRADADGLAALGVLIDGDRVIVQQAPDR